MAQFMRLSVINVRFNANASVTITRIRNIGSLKYVKVKSK